MGAVVHQETVDRRRELRAARDLKALQQLEKANTAGRSLRINWRSRLRPRAVGSYAEHRDGDNSLKSNHCCLEAKEREPLPIGFATTRPRSRGPSCGFLMMRTVVAERKFPG